MCPQRMSTASTHARTESSARTSRGSISTGGVLLALAELRLVPKPLTPLFESSPAVACPTPDESPVISTTGRSFIWVPLLLITIGCRTCAARRSFWSFHGANQRATSAATSARRAAPYQLHWFFLCQVNASS